MLNTYITQILPVATVSSGRKIKAAMQDSTLTAAPSPSPSPPTTRGGGGGGGAVAGGHENENENDAHQSEEEEEKNMRRRASVEAEVYRMKQLPVASTYAAHRLRVLGKIMHLLALPPKTRTLSEAEELELLFSSLSL